MPGTVLKCLGCSVNKMDIFFITVYILVKGEEGGKGKRREGREGKKRRGSGKKAW